MCHGLVVDGDRWASRTEVMPVINTTNPPRKGRGKVAPKTRAEMLAEFGSAPVDALVPVPVAAAVLSRGESTVWNLVKAGELTAIRLSARATRLRVGEIREYLSTLGA